MRLRHSNGAVEAHQNKQPTQPSVSLRVSHPADPCVDPLMTEFPGVKPGDCWCLCATRWVQALQAGKAPQLKLLATHEKTLSIVRSEEVV